MDYHGELADQCQLSRKEPLVADNTKTKDDFQTMLRALENQLLDVERMAGSVENSLRTETFSLLQEFRSKINDLRSLAVVMEGRIPYLIDDSDNKLKRKFALLDLLVLTCITKCYRQFIIILTNCKTLPLGAEIVFNPELNILCDTRERLSRPAYASQAASGLLVDLDSTIDNIHKVIDRAIPLADYTDLASYSGTNKLQNARAVD